MFQPILSYSIGSNIDPQSVAVGDFNDDGHLDIAVANGFSDNVGILIGVGNGKFETRMTYLTGGSYPTSIVVGDFNSDNFPDIVVTNVYSDNIGVLIGNDHGTFRMGMTISTGYSSNPGPIVAGDYNNDGYLDIAVGNTFYDDIGIFIGNGDGTFRTQTRFCTDICNEPISITTGDFNRDGKLDLAVVNEPVFMSYIEDHIHILLNNGSGYFDTILAFSIGYHNSPTSISAGDFNNDNKLDLVIVSYSTDNVVIMIGNGNGNFEESIRISTGVYTFPHSVVIADFNNDYQMDIAVTASNTHNVKIFFGTPNGTFLTQTTFSTGDASIPTGLAIGDFNNDDKLDLVIINIATNDVGILMNTCDCCVHEL